MLTTNILRLIQKIFLLLLFFLIQYFDGFPGAWSGSHVIFPCLDVSSSMSNANSLSGNNQSAPKDKYAPKAVFIDQNMHTFIRK